jgi:hypothetical protein
MVCLTVELASCVLTFIFSCLHPRLFPALVWVHVSRQGRMARGGHGLPEALLGPAMPDPSMPCGQPPLKWPYGRFRGGHLQGWRPAAVLVPPWIPHAVRMCFQVDLL